MQDFDYRSYLGELLRQRKQKNPRYGLRAFARDLDISATALSQVLSGKRHFSKSNAKKIADKLCFSPAQTQQLNQDVTQRPCNEESLQLSEDQFFAISDWYSIAILNLSNLPGCPNNPAKLAKKLGVEIKLVKQAIERLIRLGLIQIKARQLHRTAAALKTQLDRPSVALKRYHKQNLELAEHSMDHVERELREITAMTMNLPLENLPKAKKLLNDFKRRFAKAVESQDRGEVYTLSLQLFPLHKKKEG